MIKRRCKQCGKEFTLNDSEVKFFRDKNLELPKRCSKCRKENKNNNSDSNSINNKNNQNKGKGKIFRNIIAIALVVVFLIIGKVFNIPYNGTSEDRLQNNEQNTTSSFTFRNEELWEDHFIKHGNEFGYKSKEEYLDGANEVISSPYSKHKKEGEDGDSIYYDEDKNEIVFVSTDGYIRTYFKPSEGINYFNRQ